MSVGNSFSSSGTVSSGIMTGSILKNISGIGYPYNGPGPKLGGGMPGRMPPPIIGHDNSASFSRTRFLLKDSWNTTSYSGSSNAKRIATPFRAINNAGDLLSRENYSCGGTCQTFQSRPGLHGLGNRFGSTAGSCIPSVVWNATQLDRKIPSSTCNVKYVYDGSDYTRFKKNQASNRNYNDRSFGGDDYNSTQSVIKRMRI